MKHLSNFIKMSGILVLLLLFVNIINADTYTSVKDGYWGVDETWGNTIGNTPGPGDDVIINHVVGPHFNFGYYGECNNLTVNSSLTGFAMAGGSSSVTVYGNLINNGSVYSGSTPFYIYVHGNLSNFGSMTNHLVRFASTTQDQNLTVSPGYVFNCNELEAVASGFSVITANNLIFDDVNIDFNRELIMNDGASFTMQNGSYIWDMVLTTATPGSIDIHSSGSSMMHNTTINVATINLFGETYLDGNTFFNGDVYVSDFFQCDGDRFPEIYGDLIVESGAVVRDDPDGVGNMNLILDGDLTNNGGINIYKLIFSGDQVQYYDPGGGTNNYEYFYADNSLHSVILTDDLSLLNTYLNFDFRTLELQTDVVLTIDTDENIYEITLQGSSGNSVSIPNVEFCESVGFDNLTIDGNPRMASLCTFNNIILAPTCNLQAYNHYDRTIQVTGNMINHGSITQNGTGGDIILEIFGDLENNGTWEPLYTRLYGTTDQYITATEPFTGENFVSDKTSGNVIANTNVTFNGVKTDFNSNTFDLSGNTLSLDDWYFRDATIISTAKGQVVINGTEDCYLELVTIDDLLVLGTIAVGANCSFGVVEVQGTLQSRLTTSAITLPISGDISNYGSVVNGPQGNFYLHIEGDIINDGIWDIYRTDLTGATDQELSCLNGNVFAGNDFRGLKTGGDTYAITDITFEDILVDFNYSTLFCNADVDILLDGNYTSEITFEGLGSPLPRLNAINGNYFYYGSATGLELLGKVQTYGACTLEDITVQDTLQNRHGYSVTSTINGTLTNNGIIQNAGSGNLTLNAYGNIINNGLISNYTLDLRHASNDQYISCSPGGLYSTTNFYSNKVAGDIIALSDISFENTLIDGHTKTYDFSGGYDLSVDGGRLYRTNLIGSTTAKDYSVLFMDNTAYFYNSTGQDLELQGTVQTYGSSSFENILVTGTLQNHDGYSVTTPVYGNIENTGSIKNSDVSGNFTLDLHGDVINDGTWSHYNIYLKGGTPQHMSCLNGRFFELANLYCQNTSDQVIADDDLNFSGANIDFANDNLDLTGGYNLSLDGGRLYRCDVSATPTSILDFSNDAYFYNSSLDVGELSGEFELYGTNTLGTITVNGALENSSGYSVTTTITGDVTNNGEVRNNTGGGNNILLIAGHVINNGPWTNYRTDFNGTTDQEITIQDDNDITGQARFISDMSGSPYQWYYEGGILNNTDFTGETGATLTWLVDVSENYFGTFYCQTG